jgi:predicted lipoprotein with Yx(FWY)xxD motif
MKKFTLGTALVLVIAACGGAADDSTDTSEVAVDTTGAAETTTTSESMDTTTSEPEEMMGSVTSAESSLGTVLVDESGRTLYIFTVDEGDVSVCYGDCEAAWPVVMAGASVDEMVSVTTGSTTRDDGVEQLTINGRPAYRFAADAAPGDVNGQGVNGVWFVLDVDGEPIDGAVAAAETSLGTVLVDGEGRTLYIFTVDADGVSACYDQCEQNWPVVASGAVVGDGVEVTTGFTTRDDGFEQLTINGRPAYRFAGDSAPGDVNGQNVGDVWFVIGVDGEPIA